MHIFKLMFKLLEFNFVGYSTPNFDSQTSRCINNMPRTTKQRQPTGNGYFTLVNARSSRPVQPTSCHSWSHKNSTCWSTRSHCYENKAGDLSRKYLSVVQISHRVCHFPPPIFKLGSILYVYRYDVFRYATILNWFGQKI